MRTLWDLCDLDFASVDRMRTRLLLTSCREGSAAFDRITAATELGVVERLAPA